MSDRRHLSPVPPSGDDTGSRTPIHHADYERAIIGTAMMTPRVISELRDLGLTSSDFYLPHHERTWAAINTLHIQGAPCEPQTVCDELIRRRDITPALERATEGGILAWLAETYTQHQPADTALYFAEQVIDDASARRAQDLSLAIADTLSRGARGRDTAELVALWLDHERALAGPGGDHVDSWRPVDLAAIAAGDLDSPSATLTRRRDGKALLYPGAVHSVSGEPGSGKTWFALVAAAQELDAGNDVLVLDFEDRPQTIVSRLISLGLDVETITTHLHYIHPETSITAAATDALVEIAGGCSLVIVDGITEAMTMHGLSLMDNEDIARWLALIPHRLAGVGPAVLQIDHVVKNADSRGRYAIGGQHKLAGLSGAGYKLLVVKAFARESRGHAKLVVDKDRHGDVGAIGETVADLHMDATDLTGRTVRAWLDAPLTAVGDDGHFRPTTLMHRVSEFLSKSPGSTGNGIRAAVRGKERSINDAVAALVAEGYVRVEDGPRGAAYHYLVTPFDEGSEGGSDEAF